jgi:hypothetical protein
MTESPVVLMVMSLCHGITNLWSFKGQTFYIGYFDMADAIGTAVE